MKNESAVILALAAELGLEADLEVGHKTRPAWVKSSVNGVKFELECTQKLVWRLIVGYDDKINAPIVRDAFDEVAPNSKAAFFLVESSDELLEIAIRVRDYILENGLNKVGRKTKAKTADEGYFETTALAIEALVKLEAWDFLTREACGFDAHDALITIGKSAAVLADSSLPTWREHLVPCVMIRERAVEMFQNGSSASEVAQMLKENLAILVITEAEAKLVDKKYQTTMPENWAWGDSVFARLDAVGVNY